MATWINFKELRKRLDFAAVLQHYGVEIKRKGAQHHGYCPLPNHQGNRNSASFSAHLERGIFHCFGCGAKGNLLEFAALMEKTDPSNGKALHDVARKLQETFLIPAEDTVKGNEPRKDEKPVEASTSPILVNQPLDFELKGLDQAHPYLRSRGFSNETIDYFGLGVCTRGVLKGKLAIPLHDHRGRLIGYAGRVINDAEISEENPRYRFPAKRENDGKVFEFRKSRFLYNGFRIPGPVDNLIIVEGFTSVWWLHQSGFTSVVATMGSDCSERQAELIVALIKPGGRIWLIPDGDAAGIRLAESLLVQLSPRRFVRWVKLDIDRQAPHILRCPRTSVGLLRRSLSQYPQASAYRSQK